MADTWQLMRWASPLSRRNVCCLTCLHGEPGYLSCHHGLSLLLFYAQCCPLVHLTPAKVSCGAGKGGSTSASTSIHTRLPESQDALAPDAVTASPPPLPHRDSMPNSMPHSAGLPAPLLPYTAALVGGPKNIALGLHSIEQVCRDILPR